LPASELTSQFTYKNSPPLCKHSWEPIIRINNQAPGIWICIQFSLL